ncbi:uncharacterized protein LOC102365888 [Latimeria chalumnae]|uniref:uncharacterized protein LOC102365888 n=1 Tax=Latimeria chalumnae TaxID=7897 RepID=UPI00313D6021
MPGLTELTSLSSHQERRMADDAEGKVSLEDAATASERESANPSPGPAVTDPTELRSSLREPAAISSDFPAFRSPDTGCVSEIQFSGPEEEKMSGESGDVSKVTCTGTQAGVKGQEVDMDTKEAMMNPSGECRMQKQEDLSGQDVTSKDEGGECIVQRQEDLPEQNKTSKDEGVECTIHEQEDLPEHEGIPKDGEAECIVHEQEDLPGNDGIPKDGEAECIVHEQEDLPGYDGIPKDEEGECTVHEQEDPLGPDWTPTDVSLDSGTETGSEGVPGGNPGAKEKNEEGGDDSSTPNMNGCGGTSHLTLDVKSSAFQARRLTPDLSDPENHLFELLCHFQSRRLNDQRCSFRKQRREVRAWKSAPSTPTEERKGKNFFLKS